MSVLEQGQIQIHTENIFPIIKKAVYSGHEVFLRELVSNGTDAISKRRMAAMAGDCREGEDGCIRIRVDREAKTLTITDNGIGMNREEVVDNLGTIARSGTEKFLASMTGDRRKDAQLIGQFGVGFYSAYLVAERVTVSSKHNDDEQYLWESAGGGSFTVRKDPGEKLRNGSVREKPVNGTKYFLAL